MAQEEEGWPLGLRLWNARIGLVRRNGDFSGSVSFTTIFTASTTPSIGSSSDLDDTESTGSFFRDRSITLGSLIGIPSILRLSRRSSTSRGRIIMEELEPSTRDNNNNKKNHHKVKPYWLFSLCSRLTTDAVSAHGDAAIAPPSLGHYLEAERRAAIAHQRRNHEAWEQSNGYGAPIGFSCLCG